VAEIPETPGVWWAPRRASWWIGVLFAIGATCFLVAPFPGVIQAFGSGVDAAIFFIGSIFFTTAAALQCLQTFNADHRIDWWSSVIQFAGTLLFNVDTFRALQTGFDDVRYDRLVWTPDAIGSACFLISGYLAFIAVCSGPACWRRRSPEWQIAAVNLLGCIAFGIAAVASYVVPSTGSVIDLAAANFATAFGGLCFLIGAVLLLPQSARELGGAATAGHLDP
jgi:hypothetical protein